jgi:predicted GNAT family acetyltransferase
MKKVRITIEYERGEKPFEIKEGTIRTSFDIDDGIGMRDFINCACEDENISVFDAIPMADALSIVQEEFCAARDEIINLNAEKMDKMKTKSHSDENIIAHSSYWVWGKTIEMATRDGVGVARLSYAYGDKEWFFSDLYVSEENRKRGIATMLMKKAVEIVGGSEIHFKSGSRMFVKRWLVKNGFVCDGSIYSCA